MPQIRKALSVILGLFVLTLFFTKFAFAASEFTVNYDSNYVVNTNGVTTVTHNISLKNNLSSVYANQFTLTLSLTDIRNIKVRDGVGLIEPTVTKLDNQSQIQFPFADRVVGKDKLNVFSISYQTSDIAVHSGSIWEINIPRLESGVDQATHTTKLLMPSSVGQLAFISPQPVSAPLAPDDSGFVTYTFQDQSAVSKPISAVFGREQYLNFSLRYHLANPEPAPVFMEVALPPDTGYQTLYYKNIAPEPVSIRIDQDGNWLAKFQLDASGKLNIDASGIARLSFTPKAASLSADPKQYLTATNLWQTQDGQVKSLAEKLKTPLAIYQYLDDYLKYDYARVEAGGGRKGAVAALQDPTKAICTEYTDAFVALARAGGTPARELEGFAFTQNDRLRPLSLTQDILHAWPEYFDYDRQMWVQIDPTWGDTTGGVDYFHKLDLNHFVFVIHGVDPQKPLPAGAYKLKDEAQKDISITPIEASVFPAPQLVFQVDPSSTPTKPTILVKNIGTVAAAPSINLKSNPVGIINEQRTLPLIPPYGETKVVLSPVLAWSLSPQNIEVNINYDRNYTLQFSVSRPLPVAAKVAVLAFGGILICLALLASRIYLRRRTPDSSVYW